MCKSCAPGRYSSVFGATSEDFCLACPAGFMSSGHFPSLCLPCPQGTFSNQKGARACDRCLPGYFRESGTSQNATACRACPLGFSQPSAQGTSFCLGCDAGRYADKNGSEKSELHDFRKKNTTNTQIINKNIRSARIQKLQTSRN